ncbi:MAG TPA: S1 RNA-binding domain-containing protein [Dehalococcoidia bacterium]|nr:S1 RNA-binding domain-containing protein [Dehalococcoidia bacterium]HLB29677.1 S1 RNA-binding domain-containing protein [Dehalococcoidia bacterium]
MATLRDRSPQEMQDLLDERPTTRPLRRGEIVEGEVVGTGREGLIVDIGAKAEGIVPPQEMRTLSKEEVSALRPGQKILVSIVKISNREEPILLSLDRAREERGWRLLQTYMEQGDALEALVTGHNRGGLLVEVEGVQGFVPLSQVEGVRADEAERVLTDRAGSTIRLKVLELNRRRNRVILSERAALQEWRSQRREQLLEELQEGEIRHGRITSVQDFGLFIDLGGADGLAPISELAWDRSRPLDEAFKVGQELDIYILKVDQENKKIALSLRRAQPGRWEEIADRYQVGQVVVGQVTKLVDFGAFARISGGLEGLIHISEISDRRLGHPKEVMQERDIVPVKVIRIDRERHRIALSLKQARVEGEAMGFVFDEAGGILEVPEEAPTQLAVLQQEREGPREEPEGAEAVASEAMVSEEAPHPQEGEGG